MTPLLCACAVVITLETQNVEKGDLAPPIAIDRNGFRRMKEEGQIYQTLAQIFKFLPRDLVMQPFFLASRHSDLVHCPGLSYDLSKFSDDFTPFFRL